MKKLSSEEAKRLYKEAFGRPAATALGALTGGGLGFLTGEDLKSTLMGTALGAGGGFAANEALRGLSSLGRPPATGSVGGMTEAAREFVRTLGSAKDQIKPTRDVFERLKVLARDVQAHGFKGLRGRSPAEKAFDTETMRKLWGAIQGWDKTLTENLPASYKQVSQALRGFDPRQVRAKNLSWKEMRSLWKLIGETKGLFR